MTATIGADVPARSETPPVTARVSPPLPLRRQPAGDRLQVVGRLLMAAGIVTSLFIGFELSLSGLIEEQAQHSLLAQFKTSIATTALDRTTASPLEGSPVAIIEIPRVGVQQVVLEGTTPSDLKSGPGHLRGSPIPGEFGNSVIAGRRTTYGAPFGQLPSLVKGDSIRATTGQGLFTYIVTGIHHVSSGQPDPVVGASDSRLTLITSDPAYFASGRLVVTATLKGRPVGIAQRAPVLVAPGELGLSGDALGLGLGIIWAELLIAALWMAWRLRHRWPRTVVYLLATPVALALGVLTVTSFDLLLPGTL